jgi:4-amino-4-deoxy-L-arabinose transferase-like glycosyltransferase
MNKKYFFLLGILFIIHLFSQFYHLERWTSFTWDQIDNAWAALRILIAHKYPLVGMVAKANSGIYIGPLYYYLVSVFYAITRLDPIASPLLASVTSLFGFAVIYYVSKRLFDEKIALLSCFIYTFSSYIITFERSQWPVNFIAPFSLLIFYFLYKVIIGETKYCIHLSVMLGLSFHIHFTSIFYPIIIMASLPFFTYNRTTVKYFLLSVPIIGFFLVPQILYYTGANAHRAGNVTSYFQDYFHGFHFTRFRQLTFDAFVKFTSILEFPYSFLRKSVFIYIPMFILIYLREHFNRKTVMLSYLLALWIIVPWVVFSTYRGEISDYYFSLQLYIAVIVLAYISMWIWKRKQFILSVAIAAFWLYYAITNTQKFFLRQDGDFIKNKTIVEQAVREGRRIEFSDGNPQSYLYFYYIYTQTGTIPYKL